MGMVRGGIFKLLKKFDIGTIFSAIGGIINLKKVRD